ncbi:MAG: diaminopimelate decarboxylase [Anaerolineae bacterium]
MSGFHRQHTWQCEDVPIDVLADTYGTPLFVYSRQQLTTNYRRVAEAFRAVNAHIHFSVKSNGNGTLLRLLHDLGAGFDVVSGGEVFRALRAGAESKSIVFAGVGKSEAELAYALDQGVGWINVESAQELEVLDRLAASRSIRPAIALRINPVVEAATHHHIATGGHRSKFGLDLDEARAILAQPDQFSHLDMAGLHIHIGSQLASPDRTVEAIGRVLAIATPAIRLLDIGGGFPVAYRPDEHYPEPAEFAQAIVAAITTYHAPLQIAIEPGRSIIADAGALIATVQYVKVRDSRRIVVTDASMTELIRPALYEAYHHIEAVQPREPIGLAADVAGPVCESADFLGYDRTLPNVQRGDRLIVFNAGAYGMAMASNYNSRPRPAEVLVEGHTHRLIRRRETWDNLIELEIEV